MGKTIRIGGASGFWGEAVSSTSQLLQADLDYLVYDYLAEITMAILARMRAKDPEKGYATDFVTGAMAPNLKAIAKKALARKTGARGLRSILEGILLDSMYDLPSYEGVEEVVINAEVVDGAGEAKPLLVHSEAEEQKAG